jgi:hypothetical protein
MTKNQVDTEPSKGKVDTGGQAKVKLVEGSWGVDRNIHSSRQRPAHFHGFFAPLDPHRSLKFPWNLESGACPSSCMTDPMCRVAPLEEFYLYTHYPRYEDATDITDVTICDAPRDAGRV